jgi:hypothetical protein
MDEIGEHHVGQHNSSSKKTNVVSFYSYAKCIHKIMIVTTIMIIIITTMCDMILQEKP